jgi:hypothetical protein
MFKRPTDRHSPKASNLYESPVLGAQMGVEHRIEDTAAESKASRNALPAISSSEKKRVLSREEKKQMFSINIAQCQR